MTILCRRREIPPSGYQIPTLENGHRPEYTNCHLTAFRLAAHAAAMREVDEWLFEKLAALSYTYGEKP